MASFEPRLPFPLAADSAASVAMTQGAPTIRRACPDDVPQLTHLLATSFYDDCGWKRLLFPLLKLGIQEDLKQRLTYAKPYYACLAAFGPGDGQVTGTVELSHRQSWPWQGLASPHGYLSNLAVDRHCRRQGIAKALLVHCEHLARTWPITDLYLHVMEDNLHARRLYQGAGFHLCRVEETPATWLGWQARRLLLRKAIAPAPPRSTP
jgi:ribosomal protein S18 acetylase RimI-like enzyme